MAHVPPAHIRRGLRWALALLLAALAAWLSVRWVRWQELAVALGSASWFGLAAALASVLATTVAKAARWQFLLQRSGGHVPPARTLRVLVIGQLGNSFLPARLGDVARAALAGPQIEGGIPTVLGTLVAEKALDGAAGLLILAGLALVTSLPAWLRGSALVVAALTEAVLILLMLAAWQRSWTSRLRRAAAGRLPGPWQARFGQFLARFGDGVASLRTPANLLVALGWSAAVWSLAVTTNLLLRWALHIQAPGWADWLVLVSVYFATFLPTVPAQFGVFEYACILPLAMAGVGPGTALAFALALHVLVYAPPAVLGSLFAAAEGLSWAGLRRSRSQPHVPEESGQ